MIANILLLLKVINNFFQWGVITSIKTILKFVLAVIKKNIIVKQIIIANTLFLLKVKNDIEMNLYFFDDIYFKSATNSIKLLILYTC